jgi:hypothetical protein
MELAERVRLARRSYIRAVACARADPSPLAWARLLTAAKNLNEAVRAQGRESPAAADASRADP